jgi:hypothetical protein
VETAPGLQSGFAEEIVAMRKNTRKLVRRLKKEAGSSRVHYLLLTGAAAFLAERATRQAATTGWRLFYGEDPPRNPERLDVTWSQALTWTAVTGLGMTMAGLLARRGAAVGWRRYARRPIPAG